MAMKWRGQIPILVFFFWLGLVLAVAHRLSNCGTWALFACGLWDLIVLTWGQTHVPCIGRQILKPLNHQGSLNFHLLKRSGARCLISKTVRPGKNTVVAVGTVAHVDGLGDV